MFFGTKSQDDPFESAVDANAGSQEEQLTRFYGCAPVTWASAPLLVTRAANCALPLVGLNVWKTMAAPVTLYFKFI